MSETKFEDRHRELRDLDNPYLGHKSHPDCEEFEWRTGPLVDELVAAVRVLLRDLIFWSTSDPQQVWLLEQAYAPMVKARDEVVAKLAALDQAASRE